MFDSIVAHLLNKYLGKYVANLNDDNSLNVGILNGEMELNDLEFKREALFELDLPIEVKAGSIGKIHLKIPWRNLSSQSVVINIEDVMVLVGPISDRPYDPQQEKILQRAAKNFKLSQLESQTQSLSPGDVEVTSGFWEKLSATIMNNIQVYVNKVHVCYEDVVTNPDCPFVCGLALHNLSAETTNHKWKSSQVDSNATSLFKLIKLESFSFYWNPLCKTTNLTRNHIHSNNWKNILKKGLETFSANEEDFDFIVKPVSAKVKIILNKSNEAKVPRLLLDFVLQDVSCQLSRQQYLNIFSLSESFKRMSINRRFICYHPGSSVVGHATDWWHYALIAWLEEYFRPHFWSRIQKHRKRYKKYRELYKQRLRRPEESSIRQDLKEMEDLLDVTNILLAREEARIQFSKEEPNEVQRKKISRSWWKIWKSKEDAIEDDWNIPAEKDNDVWNKLEAEDKKELFDVIGYSEHDPPSEKPKQYIEHKLNFTFANCTFTLLNYGHEVLVLTLTQFMTSIETRPTAHAFRMSARAESFLVEGTTLEHDLVPLVSVDNLSGGKTRTTVPYVFALDFEKNPLRVNADYGVSMQTEPIEIVYQEHAFSEIATFCHCPKWDAQNAKVLMSEKLRKLATYLKEALNDTIEAHKKFDIAIDMKSPYLIIPEHGTIQKGGNVLVLDFGRLTITSDLQEEIGYLEEATRTELEERLYDRFNIILSDIQVLFADSGDEWRAGRMVLESDSHLIPKLRMQITLANSVKPEYKQLPRQKINVSLPSIKLNLSDGRVRQLFEFSQTVPMPKTNRIYSKSSLKSALKKDKNSYRPSDHMDMSQVVMEASLSQLRQIRFRLLQKTRKNAIEAETESTSNATTRIPLCMSRQCSDLQSSQEHSDEETEEFARTVDLPGFDDNISPHNAITTLLRFIIGEIVVQLSRSSDHVDKPYLMLRVEKVCADMALMEYGPALQASLGTIQLVDKLHMGMGGEYLELITSNGGSTDTITILYRKVKANCPEFRSHFHSVEQSVVFTLNSFKTVFHRGAFLTLYKFLQYIIERIGTKKFTSKLNSVLKMDLTQFLPSSENDPPVPTGATKFSISARVDEIRVRLCDSDMDLMESKIGHLETDFVLKANDKMILRAYLTHLAVEDLSDMTLYNKILSIADDKVFEFKYVRHSNRPSQSQKNRELMEESSGVKCDASVRLRVGRMQMCFLNKFFSDLQRFLEAFAVSGVTSPTVRALERFVQERMTSLRRRGTRVTISVDIHAPIILIPQKSDSPNLLVFRVGDLSLENFFKEVKVANGSTTPQVTDNVLIRLNSLQMNRAVLTLDGSLEELESIIEPLRLRLDVKRAIPPFHRDLLVYDIRGNVDVIKVNMGQRDLGLLLAICKENLVEEQFLEKTPVLYDILGSHATYSPVDTPSPISNSDDTVGKKLQAFFNTSVDVCKETNFIFTLEGTQLTIYYDSDEAMSSATRCQLYGLSRFEMDEACLSIEVFSDRSLEMKCALQALSLEDIRQDSQLAVKKVFQSYSGDNKMDMGMISVSMPPMIDVTYKQTQTGDVAVDIVIEKTRLNLAVPYVLALARFLYDAWPSEKPDDGGIVNPGFAGEMSSQGKGIVEGSTAKRRHASSSESTSGYYSVASTHLPEENPGLTISTKIKKPEIVLFADPTNKNSRVLVLKAGVYFDYNQNSGQNQLSISICGIQLLSCVYGKRKQTAYMVLQPSDIEFSKTIASTDDHTCNVRAALSTIDLRLSETTVHTVRDVIEELTNSIKVNKDTQDVEEDRARYKNLQDLWAVKKILPQKLLPRSDEDDCHSNRPLYTTNKYKENFVLSVPSIQVVCELEEHCKHVPVVLLRVGVEADAHDWSKQLFMKGELRLELSYYNEKLSTWQPLVEPVLQTEDHHRPWEVLVKVFRQSTRPVVCNSDDDTILVMDAVCGPYSYMGAKAISESFSSDEDSESDQDMMILRKPTAPRPKRIHAQKSYDTGSLVGYPMDSDSENEEGVLEKLTSAFGHMFSSSESSADEETSESEKEENEEEVDQNMVQTEDFYDGEVESAEEADTDGASAASPNGEKPIFLNKQGTEMGDDSVDSGVDVGSAPLATYVLVDIRDKLNVTLTPSSIKVINEVIESFSSKTMPIVDDHRDSSSVSLPFELINKIGPHSEVAVIEKSDNDAEDHEVAVAVHEDSDRLPLSPSSTGILIDITPVDSDGDLEEEGDEVDRFSISSALTQAINTSVSDKTLGYEEEDLATFYREVTKQRLDIKVDGFEKLQCFIPRNASTRVFALHPQRNDTRYHVVLDVNTHHGRKSILVCSPLRIVNDHPEVLNIYYGKKVFDAFGAHPPSDPINPFEEKLWLTTIQPEEEYHVPLFVAYHCKLFVQPAHLPYKTTENGIWWQELLSSQSRSRQILCRSKETDTSSEFAIKVACKDGAKLKLSAMSGRLIPNYTLHLLPPLYIHNCLPYTIELTVERTQEEIKLDPGEQISLSNMDLNQVQKTKLEIANYMGMPWSGCFEIHEDMDEHRTVIMKEEFGGARSNGENKQLGIGIQVERTPNIHVYMYTPYWIVNKTGLPLQFRGIGSGVVYESSLNEEPLLFRFKRHRRKKAKMRVYNSRWSSSFSLDTIKSSGLVVCKDKERDKKHQFLIKISLSTFHLTKLIVMTPYFVIVNNTKWHLRFMERNEKADLWLDIDAGLSIPFWPDTNLLQMHVKFHDSNVVSQPFHISRTHDTVLRMDRGSALCVSVQGGTQSPMTITIYPYIQGKAPVQVENWCEDLFLKIHQKSMGQVALLSPYQSVLYTWDDPTKERTLMWNIYNRTKSGFPAFIWKDGWGQERLSFHTLRPACGKSTKSCNQTTNQSSSDEDDSDITDLNDVATLPKKTRKDKVVVYWVSYLDGNQRVLMFTQDERIAKHARKSISSSKSTVECCLSISNMSLSLVNGSYKEVAYISLSNAPAVWSVEVNNRWKILPLELSSWLEDKWKTDQNRTEMKDYVQVDFNKMQMTKPFFGHLRRQYYPAVWCQYRSSNYLSYIHFKAHRLQIDNQLPDALFPTVLSPAPRPPFVVRKTGIRPFVEVALVQQHNAQKSIKTVKYFKVLIQEVNVRIDKGFLMSVYNIFDSLPSSNSLTSLAVQRDLIKVHSAMTEESKLIHNTTSEQLMFEYVHLSPLKINFSFSPKGNIHTSVSKNETSQGEIVDFLLETVGATTTEIKDVQLRLAYFQRKGIVSSLRNVIKDVRSHYFNQMIQQFYVLVLGLDVLGNPYSLIQDFTQGLGDLYYEPFFGTINNPEEYAESVANGMQIFFGHVIGGITSGSTTFFTEPMERTVATLSFEEDYKRKRRQRLQQKSGLPEAVTSATRTFSLGVSVGLSGVMVKPGVGIQQEGIEGFFKGLGKGLLSLLTKPAGGVGDMLDMANDGIRRAMEMGEEVVFRMRIPRYINPTIGVRSFSPYLSSGYRLLLRLSKGHYASTDVYWAHTQLKKEDRTTVILVTDRRIFELVHSRLWSEWEVLWKVNVDDIMAVPMIRGKKMLLKVRQDDSVNLFPGDECFITCDDTQVLHWLQWKIEKILIVHMEDKPCPACNT